MVETNHPQPKDEDLNIQIVTSEEIKKDGKTVVIKTFEFTNADKQPRPEDILQDD